MYLAILCDSYASYKSFLKSKLKLSLESELELESEKHLTYITNEEDVYKILSLGRHNLYIIHPTFLYLPVEKREHIIQAMKNRSWIQIKIMD